jgi:hypothetical protein
MPLDAATAAQARLPIGVAPVLEERPAEPGAARVRVTVAAGLSGDFGMIARPGQRLVVIIAALRSTL